jgi:hypothetical protein
MRVASFPAMPAVPPEEAVDYFGHLSFRLKAEATIQIQSAIRIKRIPIQTRGFRLQAQGRALTSRLSAPGPA